MAENLGQPQVEPVLVEEEPHVTAEDIDPTALLIEAMDIISSLTEKCQEWQQKYQTEVDRTAQLQQRVVQLEAEKEEYAEQVAELQHYWQVETDTRVRMERTVNDLEGEVREQGRRMDRMLYAFGMAFDRLWDRVSHFPSGRTRRIITRARVQYLIYREYFSALNRGLRG